MLFSRPAARFAEASPTYYRENVFEYVTEPSSRALEAIECPSLCKWLKSLAESDRDLLQTMVVFTPQIMIAFTWFMAQEDPTHPLGLGYAGPRKISPLELYISNCIRVLEDIHKVLEEADVPLPTSKIFIEGWIGTMGQDPYLINNPSVDIRRAHAEQKRRAEERSEQLRIEEAALRAMLQAEIADISTGDES